MVRSGTAAIPLVARDARTDRWRALRLDMNRARIPSAPDSGVFPPAPWAGEHTERSVIAASATLRKSAEGGRHGPRSVPSCHRLATRWSRAGGIRRGVLDLAGGTLSSPYRSPAHRRLAGRSATATRAMPSPPLRCRAIRCTCDSTTTRRSSMPDRGRLADGVYRRLGNRGPRVIPFRAAARTLAEPRRCRMALRPVVRQFHGSVSDTPRILVFQQGKAGLEGTIIGQFRGLQSLFRRSDRDSFALYPLDGSFVYLLAGRRVGDTLRGTFHGLRRETSFIAVRARGPPLTTATESRGPIPPNFRFASPMSTARS